MSAFLVLRVGNEVDVTCTFVRSIHERRSSPDESHGMTLDELLDNIAAVLADTDHEEGT